MVTWPPLLTSREMSSLIANSSPPSRPISSPNQPNRREVAPRRNTPLFSQNKPVADPIHTELNFLVNLQSSIALPLQTGRFTAGVQLLPLSPPTIQAFDSHPVRTLDTDRWAFHIPFCPSVLSFI